MSDRELLELAAKAAGLGFHPGCEYDANGGLRTLAGWWNPLAVSGEALELAVQLGLQIITSGVNVKQAVDYSGGIYGEADVGDDPYAATRRAIVRAAAEIARATGA